MTPHIIKGRLSLGIKQVFRASLKIGFGSTFGIGLSNLNRKTLASAVECIKCNFTSMGIVFDLTHSV